MSFISLVVLLIVFILIAVRQVGKVRLQIWHIMLGGALAVLLLGQITPNQAWTAINLDVIVFLAGMFIVGRGLEESGYLAHISFHVFKRARSVNLLILFILFFVGIASAMLMNDTLAIIGTPVMLHLASKHRIRATTLLLALCFAVTIGSAMSPIGNPQNLLIALNGGIPDPFIAFLRHLLLPTLINLLVAYVFLRVFYGKQFHDTELKHDEEPIKDPALANLSKIALGFILAAIILKIAFVILGVGIPLPLTAIAVVGALPILLHRRRIELVRTMDWQTLIFFAAMFVLMASVWQTGFFQGLLTRLALDVTSTPVILGVSVLLSQLISNVPLVALYLPLLLHAGATQMSLITLAAGSTIAGNLLILGAASNIIVIQSAEARGETITFWEFARIGIPLTIINVLVYAIFL